MDPSQRPWALRGEVQGKDRPRNSLLGSDATWDGVSKDPPPLDAAFGLRVEEVIKERVLAQNFDDIVPQTVVEEAYRERRSGKVEDQDDGALGQKSKLGLSEEYERDYVERQENGEKSDKRAEMKHSTRSGGSSRVAWMRYRTSRRRSSDRRWTRKSSRLGPKHRPCSSRRRRRRPTEEGLAPEEVRAKKRGREELQRSQEEATRDERKAQRLAKKKARNAKRKKLRADARIVAKVAPDLKNPYEAKRVVRRVQQAEGGDQGSTAGRASSSSSFRRRSARGARRRRAGAQEETAGEGVGGEARLASGCQFITPLPARSVFSFCGLLGFDTDRGPGWRHAVPGDLTMVSTPATRAPRRGSFSGSAAGAKCVCCVENMGGVDADDRGLRPTVARRRVRREMI